MTKHPAELLQIDKKIFFALDSYFTTCYDCKAL